MTLIKQQKMHREEETRMAGTPQYVAEDIAYPAGALGFDRQGTNDDVDEKDSVVMRSCLTVPTVSSSEYSVDDTGDDKDPISDDLIDLTLLERTNEINSQHRAPGVAPTTAVAAIPLIAAPALTPAQAQAPAPVLNPATVPFLNPTPASLVPPGSMPPTLAAQPVAVTPPGVTYALTLVPYAPPARSYIVFIKNKKRNRWPCNRCSAVRSRRDEIRRHVRKHYAKYYSGVQLQVGDEQAQARIDCP